MLVKWTNLFFLHLFQCSLICGLNKSLLISKNWLILVQNLKSSISSQSSDNYFFYPSVPEHIFLSRLASQSFFLFFKPWLKCLLKLHWLLLCSTFLFRIYLIDFIFLLVSLLFPYTFNTACCLTILFDDTGLKNRKRTFLFLKELKIFLLL